MFHASVLLGERTIRPSVIFLMTKVALLTSVFFAFMMLIVEFIKEAALLFPFGGPFREEYPAMHYRSTKEEICCLVELELSPEEEWTELYREWKQAELQDLWLELKRV